MTLISNSTKIQQENVPASQNTPQIHPVLGNTDINLENSSLPSRELLSNPSLLTSTGSAPMTKDKKEEQGNVIEVGDSKGSLLGNGLRALYYTADFLYHNVMVGLTVFSGSTAGSYRQMYRLTDFWDVPWEEAGNPRKHWEYFRDHVLGVDALQIRNESVKKSNNTAESIDQQIQDAMSSGDYEKAKKIADLKKSLSSDEQTELLKTLVSLSEKQLRES